MKKLIAILFAVVMTLLLCHLAYASSTDDFDDDSINTDYWGTATSGSGAVTESGEHLLINCPSSNDAAILYRKDIINTTTEQTIYTMKAYSPEAASNYVHLLAFANTVGAPTPDTAANFGTKVIARVLKTTSNNFTISYRGSGGTWYYWDTAANDFTTTATVFTIDGDLYDGALAARIIVNAGKFALILADAGMTKEHIHTTWVNFTDLSQSDELYLFAGDPFTDFGTAENYNDRFVDFTKTEDELEGYINAATPAFNTVVMRVASWDNGETWFLDPATPVVQPSDYPAEAGTVLRSTDPFGYLDGSTYYLWVSTLIDDTVDFYEQWLFTSSDGKTFTASGTAPKITKGGVGDIDEKQVQFIVAIKDPTDADSDKLWKFYYGAVDSSSVWSMGYAWAADPTDASYTKHGSAVISNSAGWDADFLRPSGFHQTDSAYALYYSAYNGPKSKGGIATSTDWTTWTKSDNNPIIQGQSTKTLGITTLTAGSATVTTASGADTTFTVGDGVVYLDSGETVWETNRIKSIDSPTQITLESPASAAFSSGKIKSISFGSIVASGLQFDSSFIYHPVIFHHKDGIGYTLEMVGYASGSAYDSSITIDDTKSPSIPLGEYWNTVSCENLQIVSHNSTPITALTTSTDPCTDYAVGTILYCGYTGTILYQPVDSGGTTSY